MMWRNVLDGMIWAAFGPGARFVQAVPERFAGGMAQTLGFAHATLRLPLLGPRIEYNMRSAFGSDFRRYWVRRNLQVLYRSASDLLRLPRYSEAHLLQQLGTLENADDLRRRRARGAGCVLLGLHFGNHRCLAPGLAAMGYPISNLIARFPRPQVGIRSVTQARVSRFRAAYIDRSQVDYVNLSRDKTPHVVNALVERVQQGRFLLLLADGCIGHRRQPIQFLEHELALPVGAATIAARAGAPLIPILSIPQTQKVFVGDAIPVDCGSVAAALQRVMAALEPMVRAYPWEWWTWFHLGPDGPPGSARRWRLLSGAEAFAPQCAP